VHTDIDAAADNEHGTGGCPRCEQVEARNRVLEERFRYLRNAVRAVSDDEL
jgi:hypothetical protein